ncbi:hypothetical protein BDV95DRAFT_561553 [Massariosphaeria phaeospora]|uniref:DUF6594 domain-containing protein n=1 Tax=Massariosphaeria phaeospora TaxID=100035 RepID=A0A7C8MH93_9PLEO|nr:hypothetical protein BDV95DRAFT_561553 [Massariosphaeria phaeospora]
MPDSTRSSALSLPRRPSSRPEFGPDDTPQPKSSTCQSKPPKYDHRAVHRRSRPAEDVSRSRKQKHSSLQRCDESSIDLVDRSSISVLPGITRQSQLSTESNSTITQNSYNKSHVARAASDRKQGTPGRTPAEAKAMAAHHSALLQHMEDEMMSEDSLDGVITQDYRPMPSSSSSDSSSDTEHDEDLSSNADEPPLNSTMTSPAPVRRPDHEQLRHRGRSFKRPARFIVERTHESNQYQPMAHQDEESDEEDDDVQRGEDKDEVSSYSAEDSEEHPGNALERIAPPRVPSASSSRHSDPHTRQLKRQEQELRNHILQSPQPQRDFQFAGGPSPNPQPLMALYDADPHSATSSVNMYAPVPTAWPPVAPPPPPLEYLSPPHALAAPHPPGSQDNFAMTPHLPMAPPSSVDQMPPYQQVPIHPPNYQPPLGPDLNRTTIVGYELLAGKLTEASKDGRNTVHEGGIVPMYRRFEQLNHRVLLHLQDEIAELEEELRYLDECIAQSSPRAFHAVSRRGEARYGSELHWRRTELLGRIYLKLGQYNQGLTSFTGMLKNLDPAGTEDIQAYRSWIEARAPIDPAEMEFLERKNDLLAVSRGRAAGNADGAAHAHSPAIWLPLMLVLPLMVFAIVPSVLGRLFITVLIGAAEVKLVVTSTELMEFMTVREWVVCASGYFGLMAVLAAMVH